jgi:hypothetical protein
MPIEHTIDHHNRLVQATARGIMTDQDVFTYQRAVWSRGDVAGFNELIDMSHVERIELPSAARLVLLAQVAAASDAPAAASRLAIVAPGDHAFGLGRMYQAHRALEPGSTKQVGVFRSMPEALAFLGIEQITE